MTLRAWLRSGLVAGGLLLAADESLAQRGGGGPSGGGPGGGGGFPGMGGFGGMGRGMGGSPEDRWASFAGNADSIDLKDPKNAMMAGLLSRKYQIPPDGVLRRSAYVEQATKMGPPGGGTGGSPGMGGPPGVGGPGGYPTAPGAAPGAAPGGTVVVVGPGSDPAIAPPGPGGPGGFPSGRGDRGPGGDRQQGDRQQGDPIEDPRPFVIRYGNMPKDAAPFFNDLDKDRDGQISLYEWRTGGKGVEDFVVLDLNNDGFLTVEEHRRAIQLAAEEKNGGKKLTDSRFGGRGPGGGGGNFGPGSRGPGGDGGAEQPSKGGDSREERGGKGGKGGKG